MKRTKIDFTDICDAVKYMATPDHDLMVVEPADTVTRFTSSVSGRGRAMVEVSEIPAMFDAIKANVWHALQNEGWNLTATRRGFIATRRTGAAMSVREAA